MGFDPGEIEHKEFVPGLRGYRKSEVRAFLRSVASDVARLESELDANERRKAPAKKAAPAPSISPISGGDAGALLQQVLAELGELRTSMLRLESRLGEGTRHPTRPGVSRHADDELPRLGPPDVHAEGTRAPRRLTDADDDRRRDTPTHASGEFSFGETLRAAMQALDSVDQAEGTDAPRTPPTRRVRTGLSAVGAASGTVVDTHTMGTVAPLDPQAGSDASAASLPLPLPQPLPVPQSELAPERTPSVRAGAGIDELSPGTRLERRAFPRLPVTPPARHGPTDGTDRTDRTDNGDQPTAEQPTADRSLPAAVGRERATAPATVSPWTPRTAPIALHGPDRHATLMAADPFADIPVPSTATRDDLSPRAEVALPDQRPPHTAGGPALPPAAAALALPSSPPPALPSAPAPATRRRRGGTAIGSTAPGAVDAAATSPR